MYDPNKLLHCIPAARHSEAEIRAALEAHPEVKFVSVVGLDVFGHDTDEKIPMRVFLSDVEGFLTDGVQTDGSSVFLPCIADISNARVDLIPDRDVNWYIEYNPQNCDHVTGLPVGTLRIPAFLIHDTNLQVGSRIILKDAVSTFRSELMKLLKKKKRLLNSLGIASADEISEIVLTAATELEFYVRTPHESADKERLMASQEMKEQYWKRTLGPVRTALERTIEVLERYGFGVEMGHKEVGGVKAEMMEGGDYSHIMEQLEIDWKYSDPMQAADNDRQIRYIVRDAFRENGLDVTFMAKPVAGVAGSGKHTHIGVCAKLTDGKTVNLFTAGRRGDYMSEIGFGALMGLLKNYEIIEPFAAATNDSFNRLKPGYEAPVCCVTSLGRDAATPSRNRTVLIGLVRDAKNPMSTRFELRSPSPKSNTYLVLASALLSMLDGIKAALASGKNPSQLLLSVSKKYGEEDFYLDTDRIYRAENNIFDDYTQEDRDRLFGKAPETVFECISAFGKNPEKTKLLMQGQCMTELDIRSYEVSALSLWASELHERLIPETKSFIRGCVKVHGERSASLDESRWSEIESLRKSLMQDEIGRLSLTGRLSEALEKGDYALASDLQLELQRKVDELDRKYRAYRHNIL